MTLVFISCSLLSVVIVHWQRVIKVPHDGRNVTVVWCVDDTLWMGGTNGGRVGFKWHQPAHHFAVTLKPIRKAYFSGEMLSIGISYVVIARSKPA